jgi:hypothetical protein
MSSGSTSGSLWSPQQPRNPPYKVPPLIKCKEIIIRTKTRNNNRICNNSSNSTRKLLLANQSTPQVNSNSNPLIVLGAQANQSKVSIQIFIYALNLSRIGINKAQSDIFLL